PPNDPKLPEGAVGIKIGQVIRNTGAERAGLKDQDVVIEIDGTPLAELGILNGKKFSEAIRSRRPGTRMRLTILRAGTQIDVETILGRAPADRRNVVETTTE